MTGATGYLGSRLCGALADAGHAVRAFALRSAGGGGGGGDVEAGLLPASVELAYGDVADVESSPPPSTGATPSSTSPPPSRRGCPIPPSSSRYVYNLLKRKEDFKKKLAKVFKQFRKIYAL